MENAGWRGVTQGVGKLGLGSGLEAMERDHDRKGGHEVTGQPKRPSDDGRPGNRDRSFERPLYLGFLFEQLGDEFGDVFAGLKPQGDPSQKPVIAVVQLHGNVACLIVADIGERDRCPAPVHGVCEHDEILKRNCGLDADLAVKTRRARSGHAELGESRNCSDGLIR